MRTFEIIYADPPWSYEDRCHAGGRGAGYKYEVLTIPQIAKLDVASLASPAGCALFMWATYPLLPEAFEVLTTWGFQYRTVAFTWFKTTSTGAPFFGMGNWTRSGPEVVLLGTRGSIRRQSASVRNCVTAAHEGHSRKPDVFAKLIVELMGDRPRIELFARRRMEGWSAWGNEVECDVTLEVPPPGPAVLEKLLL